ncbi:phospholipase D-like domain-containing protein [Wenzhouxiangella limi]|uniref:Cardiolipin synthase n=1 Tax=Wenzhouxiangella limi TaxID=2707351 RepID=A0A845V707_9GAMM|nr:phospholipase D-like domain-containing protein [Wenzhouxiangella limi]NDY95961.1 cardiolipin synthase [Wenzhouxiangella limi]
MSFETLIALLFHALLAPATAIHALLYKRDPKAAFGWIAVCILFPLAGPVLYLFFGLNRVRGKAQGLGLPGFSIGYERGAALPETHPLPSNIPPAYRELARVGQALSRHPLVGGNHVEPLVNGEQAYPAMLAAIDDACHHVLLTTYILDNDRTSRRFVAALQRAVQRGVDVRILIDGFGDLYSWPRSSKILQRAGIQVGRFLPPRLLPPSLSINMRNHHKILVIDDAIGFAGGMNIGERHCLDIEDNKRPTADVQFVVKGPAVGQLREEFLRMWRFSTEDSQDPDCRVPTRSGSLLCRTVTDGPDEDLDKLMMLLNAAIGEARRSVRIMTPYFLPPRELISAIQAACVRGVDVLIVLPARNNLPYIHWATRNMLWEILFRGARVYYQPPPFNHSKLFVVDNYYSLIGSTNWDTRSLRLNFELQVEVYGDDFARDLAEQVEAAADRGREVTLTEVDGRPLPQRLRDSLSWLFSPYL